MAEDRTDDRLELIGIREAADMLGVHVNTLRGWADRGLVPHVKLPSGYRRFVKTEIEQARDAMRFEGRRQGKVRAA